MFFERFLKEHWGASDLTKCCCNLDFKGETEKLLQNKYADVSACTYLGHDYILTLANVAALGLDDCLEELEVLHVTTVGLDAANKVLHHSLGNFITLLEIVLENGPSRFHLQQLKKTYIQCFTAIIITCNTQPKFIHV